ncbi:urocortin-3 [Molothrus ater]|nr:urocortin-3 [Molothrus ater]XP_054488321.1 urocortin-3 [Agelaius phoeniceus]
MSHPRLLLLLVLLGAAGAGRALSLSSAASILSCLQAALAEPRRILPEDNAVLEKRGSASPSLEEASQEDMEEEEEELGKRTFPGDGHHKYVSQAQGKGKTQQNRAKSDRRTKVTLSLDVPTNIMNILFNIAKAKNLRAKAAANAHLMAQIGRRK